MPPAERSTVKDMAKPKSIEESTALLDELEAGTMDGFMAFRPVWEGGRVLDFEWLYVNPSAEHLTGRHSCELRGQRFLEVLKGYRDSELFHACCRAIQAGEPSVQECLDPQDPRRWYRIAVARFRNGLTVRFHDITQQKQTAQELLDRDLRYRLISQATNDVLWDWDLKKGYVQWGEAVYNVLGYRRGGVAPTVQWWIEHIHPEDRERVVRDIDHVIEGPSDAWADEYRFQRADGTYAFYFDRGFVAREADGTPYRMLGSMVDLTERVRAEEALLESEERFRATFSQAAVGMALVSPGGKWLRVNQKLCDVVGYECDALLGTTLEDLTHPEDAQATLRKVQRVLAGELKSHSTETRLLKKDGSEVWVNFTISLVREAGGTPKWFVAILEDINERKRLEQEARRAAEFESQLHGIVGHDIRSPLAAIKATVSALLLKPDLPEAYRKAMGRIARSTERIQRLVQQLLDYTRARIGDGIPVHPRSTDIHEVCRRVVEEFSETHPGRVLLFLTEVDGHGYWDSDRLMQLLSNLVENALKYGATGEPVGIAVEGTPEEVSLQVHNMGEPIPPALIPTLFEPFRRGAQSEQTARVSLGLGLYVVREVARAHGGTVAVHSTREEGTTLTVRLPRHPPARGLHANEPVAVLH